MYFSEIALELERLADEIREEHNRRCEAMQKTVTSFPPTLLLKLPDLYTKSTKRCMKCMGYNVHYVKTFYIQFEIDGSIISQFRCTECDCDQYETYNVSYSGTERGYNTSDPDKYGEFSGIIE